jgi:hypothetical protein
MVMPQPQRCSRHSIQIDRKTFLCLKMATIIYTETKSETINRYPTQVHPYSDEAKLRNSSKGYISSSGY